MTCMISSFGKRSGRVFRTCVLALACLAIAVHPAFGQGLLDQIRCDVRTSNRDRPPAPAESPPPSDCGDSCRPKYSYNDSAEYVREGLFSGVFWLSVAAAAAPFLGPHAIVGDDFSVTRSFARFPYDGDSGYMSLYGGKGWAAQFSSDYATEFNDLDQVGGRLRIDTLSRWGIDTDMKYFQESVPAAARDSLWLGDCNITYRFAQGENMQWRTGLGFNWMDDADKSDFGFNFTYGFDWFPRRPWVVSAEIDWGTLGHSGLFHFRGTVGAMLNRLEAYTGYEYYDFDDVQTNMLIGGVRIWF